MDATFWTALAAIAGVIGLGVVLIGHIIRYAYQKGISDQRLNAVEAALREQAAKIDSGHALAITVEGLKATVASLMAAVERLDEVILHLPERASRRPKPASVG